MRALLYGVVASGVLVTGAVHAADLTQPAPAGYNWSGLYIGIGGGAGAGVGMVEPFPFFDGLSGAEGIFGEVTIGYDYLVSPRFLVGLYADARYGDISTSLDAGGVGSGSLEADYGFDILARAGYVITPRSLVYVLGGYSYQHFDADLLGFNDSWSSSGFVVGAGLETALAGNWSLKSEYRYSSYGSEDLGGIGFGVESDPSFHTFHVGLNYRFGASDSASATAFEPIAYNWTGFYVGAALGAGGLVNDLSLLGGAIDMNGIGADGVLGEVSVGYDHEFANGIVAGVMADARLSGISRSGSGGIGGDFSLDADYGFDLLGRIGMKVSESTLAYAIGGYSWQHFDIDIPAAAVGPLESWGSSGFTIGAGIETAVTQNVTLNLEYRYAQYGDEDFNSGGLIELEPSSHTVRAGLKWKFF